VRPLLKPFPSLHVVGWFDHAGRCLWRIAKT